MREPEEKQKMLRQSKLDAGRSSFSEELSEASRTTSMNRSSCAQKLDQREEESAATPRNKLSPDEESKLKELAEKMDQDTGVTTLMLACRLPATYQARHLISHAIIPFSPV